MNLVVIDDWKNDFYYVEEHLKIIIKIISIINVYLVWLASTKLSYIKNIFLKKKKIVFI